LAVHVCDLSEVERAPSSPLVNLQPGCQCRCPCWALEGADQDILWSGSRFRAMLGKASEWTVGSACRVRRCTPNPCRGRATERAIFFGRYISAVEAQSRQDRQVDPGLPRRQSEGLPLTGGLRPAPSSPARRRRACV